MFGFGKSKKTTQNKLKNLPKSASQQSVDRLLPIMATTSPLTSAQEIKIIKEVIEEREQEKT